MKDKLGQELQVGDLVIQGYNSGLLNLQIVTGFTAKYVKLKFKDGGDYGYRALPKKTC